MGLIRLLLFFFLFYLLYKLFFRYVIPYFKGTSPGVGRGKRQYFHQDNRYDNASQSSSGFGRDAEYADYEEVK